MTWTTLCATSVHGLIHELTQYLPKPRRETTVQKSVTAFTYLPVFPQRFFDIYIWIKRHLLDTYPHLLAFTYISSIFTHISPKFSHISVFPFTFFARIYLRSVTAFPWVVSPRPKQWFSMHFSKYSYIQATRSWLLSYRNNT